MTNQYNFDDIKEESPEIILGGHTYTLEYPTLEEVEKLQTLKTDEERTDAIFSYVKKTEDSQPEFKDLLRKQSIKVTIAFTEMVSKEFGVEEK